MGTVAARVTGRTAHALIFGTMRYAPFLLALSLLAAPPAAAQGASSAATADTAAPLSYPIEFDSVQVYLMTLVPPDGRENVRNLRLSGQGDELRVDAEVRVGALPGLELFGGLGWAHVSGTGPVRIIEPGVMGWEIRTMTLADRPVFMAIWGPLVQRLTKRPDTIVPFAVGRWVKRVEVQPTRLMLY